MGGHDYMKANLMDAKRRQVMDGVAVPEATLFAGGSSITK